MTGIISTKLGRMRSYYLGGIELVVTYIYSGYKNQVVYSQGNSQNTSEKMPQMEVKSVKHASPKIENIEPT